MDSFAQQLKSYIETHPFDSGDSDCATVLDQLYQAYADSHESDPQEIRDAFEQLVTFWKICRWWITICSLVLSAASASPTIRKLTAMASNMGRT